jgi:hypothetical protein
MELPRRLVTRGEGWVCTADPAFSLAACFATNRSRQNSQISAAPPSHPRPRLAQIRQVQQTPNDQSPPQIRSRTNQRRAKTEWLRSMGLASRTKDNGQSAGPNVRFGSPTDIATCPRQVRFTPNTGHSSGRLECRLRATSGHPHRKRHFCKRGGRSSLIDRTSILACRAKRPIARHRCNDLVVVPRAARLSRRFYLHEVHVTHEPPVFRGACRLLRKNR